MSMSMSMSLMSWAVNHRMLCVDASQDPGEHIELSTQKPHILAKLKAALVAGEPSVIQTKFGLDDPKCCSVAAELYGGYLGPFLDL